MKTATKPAVERTAAQDTDTELTPREAWEPIMEWLGLTEFDLDPCGHPLATVPCKDRITLPADGLKADWWGCCWLNPPYSDPAPWIDRAAAHGEEGGSCVCLLKADPSTRVWERTIWPLANAVLLPYRKIRYIKPGSDRTTTAKWPSAVVVFGLPVRPRSSWGRVVMGGP